MIAKVVQTLANGQRKRPRNEGKELNDCKNYFIESTSEPLFKKTRKRISRLSCNDSLLPRCTSQRSEVLEKLFQEMKGTPACVKPKPPKKTINKESPTSIRKGPVYNKLQAETLTMQKNRYSAMRQRAHMNRPSVQKQKTLVETANSSKSKNKNLPSSRPTEIQFQKDHVLSMPKFDLKQYKIPKKKDNCQKSEHKSCIRNKARDLTVNKNVESNGKKLCEDLQKKKKIHKKDQPYKTCTNKEKSKCSALLQNSKSSKTLKKVESITATCLPSTVSSQSLNLQKPIGKRRSFKRICIDSDDDDDNSIIRRPHLKNCRRIVSSPEESDCEELVQESQQNIHSTSSNESVLPINYVTDAEALKAVSTLKEIERSTITLNDKDNSNNDEDIDIENAVTFEDGNIYNFNDCINMQIENVKSMAKAMNFKEKLPTSEFFSQTPLIRTINQENYVSRTSSKCGATGNKQEIPIIILDSDKDSEDELDNEDDEIFIIEEKLNSNLPSNSCKFYNYQPSGTVQELFKKSKKTEANDVMNLLINYLHSSDKDLIGKELLKKITAQSAPTCVLCKGTTMLKTCSRCDQILCKYICDKQHRCSFR